MTKLGYLDATEASPRRAGQWIRPVQSLSALFLDLPRELRDLIYDFALDWNEIDKTIAEFQDSPPSHIRVTLSTPTILLLCRQITDEALPVLRNKPLVIRRALAGGFPDPLGRRTLTSFISARTLQQVKRIVFHADGPVDTAEGPADLCCRDPYKRVRSLRSWKYYLLPALSSLYMRSKLEKCSVIFYPNVPTLEADKSGYLKMWKMKFYSMLVSPLLSESTSAPSC